MKINPFFSLLTCCIAVCSCSPDLWVNTTDGQNSLSIAEARKSGLFLQEYRVAYSPPGFLQIQEAWAEHIWWHAVKGGEISKDVDTSTRQLCIKSDDARSIYQLKNAGNTDTLIADSATGRYLARHGIWNVSLNNGNLPDTITLNIFFKPGNAN